MDQTNKASTPPENEHGIPKNIEETFSFEKEEDAEEMFVIAKERLLNVNKWNEITESIPTKFHITDAEGHALHRELHKGDLIAINITGPDSYTGEGKDWVTAEAIDYDDYPDENKEVIAVRLRPVSSPNTKDKSTAHFFSNKSTSTFVIERSQKTLTAKYYGRNETLNTKTDNVIDKVRNTVVGIGALLGFSDIQWKGLLKGFLKIDE